MAAMMLKNVSKLEEGRTQYNNYFNDEHQRPMIQLNSLEPKI
jgi:hypothetical protein